MFHKSHCVAVGQVQINLKPLGQRSPISQVVVRLKKATAELEGLTVGMQTRQDIQVGGRSSASQYQYTLQDPDSAELDKWAAVMAKTLASLPELQNVISDKQKAATSLTLDIDRATASRLGVSVDAIDQTLYDAFGQRQVATLFIQVSQYHVVMELDPRFALSQEALSHLYVRSTTTDKLIPLSLLGSLKTGVMPVSINHQGSMPATTLSFNLKPGRSWRTSIVASIHAGWLISIRARSG